MNTKAFEELIQTTGNPCVSLIIPTHRTSPSRMQDSELLEKAIREATSLLQKKKEYAANAPIIIQKLNELSSTIDFSHQQDGLGIFVSEKIGHIIKFPFVVEAKIIIDSTFETRDLYYLKQFSKPYFVLNLSKDEAHLFLAEAGKLVIEITDGHFPMKYTDDYIYEKVSLGTSFGYSQKGFERDKGEMVQIRRKSFFQEVSENLIHHLKNGDRLLVSGTKKIIAEFESAKNSRCKISAKVIGSFGAYNLNELLERTWNSNMEITHLETEKILEKLPEFDGQNKLASGLRHAWTAAMSGKGKLLLVEKDYRAVGYVKSDHDKIMLRVPQGDHATIPDAVDQLIEEVIRHKGSVLFTQANQLENYEHVALILRY